MSMDMVARALAIKAQSGGGGQGDIDAHNVSATSHQDIRKIITDLETKDLINKLDFQKDTWNENTSYPKNRVVVRNSFVYISLIDNNIGNQPNGGGNDDSYWKCLSSVAGKIYLSGSGSKRYILGTTSEGTGGVTSIVRSGIGLFNPYIDIDGTLWDNRGQVASREEVLEEINKKIINVYKFIGSILHPEEIDDFCSNSFFKHADVINYTGKSVSEHVYSATSFDTSWIKNMHYNYDTLYFGPDFCRILNVGDMIRIRFFTGEESFDAILQEGKSTWQPIDLSFEVPTLPDGSVDIEQIGYITIEHKFQINNGDNFAKLIFEGNLAFPDNFSSSIDLSKYQKKIPSFENGTVVLYSGEDGVFNSTSGTLNIQGKGLTVGAEEIYTGGVTVRSANSVDRILTLAGNALLPAGTFPSVLTAAGIENHLLVHSGISNNGLKAISPEAMKSIMKLDNVEDLNLENLGINTTSIKKWDINTNSLVNININFDNSDSGINLNIINSSNSSKRGKAYIREQDRHCVRDIRITSDNSQIKWAREPLIKINTEFVYFLEAHIIDNQTYIDWSIIDDTQLSSRDATYLSDWFPYEFKTAQSSLSQTNSILPKISSITLNRNIQIDSKVFEFFPMVITLDRPALKNCYIQLMRYGKHPSRHSSWEFRRIPIDNEDFPVIEIEENAMQINITQDIFDELYRPPRKRGKKSRSWEDWAATPSGKRHNPINGIKAGDVQYKFAVLQRRNDKNIKGEPSSQTLKIARFIQTNKDNEAILHTKTEIKD